jgi:hypothetical protein
VNKLDFSCSYTKLKDVERKSQCGRRATRRDWGDPKCIGHWVVEQVIARVGGTEYARKVWVAASYILLSLAVEYLTTYWSKMPNLLLACATITFCAGLFISAAWQHPSGGILCLISVPLLGWDLLRSGVGSLRLYLDPAYSIPEHSSLALQLLGSSLDVEIGLIFAAYTAGFYYFYRYDDHRWMTFARRSSIILGLIVVLSLAILIIGTGRFSPLAPWVIVVLPAVVIARGTNLLKKLARRLAAALRV